MKKFLSLATLSLVALIGQLGCAPQNGPNTSSSNANMATPEATPDKAAIETELLRNENDFARVLKERDGEAIRRVEADDIIEVIPDGSTSTKEQDIADIKAGNLSADSWEVVEAHVTVLDNNAAVVTGRTVIKGGKAKGPDNRSMDISGEYRFVDTFARREGQWKLVATAIVKIQKPAAAPTPKSSPSPVMKASPAMKPSPTVKPSPAVKPSPPKSMASPAKTAASPIKTKTP